RQRPAVPLQERPARNEWVKAIGLDPRGLRLAFTRRAAPLGRPPLESALAALPSTQPRGGPRGIRVGVPPAEGSALVCLKVRASGGPSPPRRPRSGRPDSNWRPPRPKRGALTRLSYVPSALKGTHCMAIRANELALRDLRQDQRPVVSLEQ